MAVRPFILLCGFTGVGKTTLLQAICGNQIVPDNAIGHGEPTTNSFKYYENGRFRFLDTVGMTPEESSSEYKKRIVEYYQREYTGKPDEDCPFIIWYCIAGCGGRVVSNDLDFLKQSLTIITILTKSDITKNMQLDSIRQVLIREGIKSERIVTCSSDQNSGIDKLVELTDSLTPEALATFKEFRQKLSSCYIATAVYGRTDHINVVTLRKFRDNFLNRFYIGKVLIKFYYNIGPYFAQITRNNQWLKAILKKFLDAAVIFLEAVGI